jgi:uncharacterized protein YrzB (UPF0473 family)
MNHCSCGHDHDHEHEQEHSLDTCHEDNGGFDDVITLVDEDGAEHEFEIADTFDRDGTTYVALIPVFDTAEELLDDTGELVVLKVVADGAQEYLEAIDNEEEFDRISKEFMERLQDDYDFEEYALA